MPSPAPESPSSDRTSAAGLPSGGRASPGDEPSGDRTSPGDEPSGDRASPGAGPGGDWRWALVFVGAVHLLTAAGAPMIGDHLEMIAMARRFLRTGSFTISDASPLPPVVPRLDLAEPGGEYRPRFFPGTPLAHVPLHLLDRALGIDGAPTVGRFVHYTGHLYVLAALALIGLALRSAGASPQATAAAVVLTGTSWPIWQIARQGGAEPVIAFAVGIFLLALIRDRPGVRVGVCGVLPWLHPTGALIGGVLALGGAVDPSRPLGGARDVARRAAPALAATALGAASVALIWNGLYLGSLVGGGYASSIEGSLFSQPPLQVFLDEYLSQCALFVPALVLLGLGALAPGARRGLPDGRWAGARLLFVPAGLFLVLAALFSVLAYQMGHDPVRRLSVVWLAWGFLAGRVWDSLPLTPFLPRAVFLFNLSLGLYWFRLRDWTWDLAGDGSRLPLVQWLTWRIDGVPGWWIWPGALAVAALAAGFALWRLLGPGPAAQAAPRETAPVGPAGRATMP